MKSKTSCYDCATGRMELKRFAPLWVLYAVGLLLLTTLVNNHYSDALENALQNTRDLVSYTAIYNFGYALVLAQVLFGDLYNSRLCYAIHALPIPKGGWFGTQITLGIMGTLIPNLLNTGLLLVMLTQYKIVALWWLMASLAQFLCFFGIATLCAICAGNRLGMAILYGLINFLDCLLAWFRMKLYAPLIYGLYIPDPDAPLSPIYWMIPNQVFDIQYERVPPTADSFESGWDRIISGVTANKEVFLTLAIWAAVGCAAIWFAMRLYRKRKLECAGDLLAFPKTELPFLVLVTLSAGGFGHLCAQVLNWQMSYLLLALGLILGYYGCLMLLKRQVNVFHLKTLAPLGVIGCVFLLTLVLTGLDLFGITYRMPKAEDVASVSLNMSYYSNNRKQITDPADIRSILEIQEEALNDHRRIESSRPLLARIFGDEGRQNTLLDGYGSDRVGMIFILYTLKNGSSLNRIYFYPDTSPVAPQLSKFFSAPEVVFESYDGLLFDENGTLVPLVDGVTRISLSCNHEKNEYGGYGVTQILPDGAKNAQGLIDAILADCEAGTMAQSQFFHPNSPRFDYIGIDTQLPGNPYPSYLYFQIYPECENTFRWLVENGYHSEEYATYPDSDR